MSSFETSIILPTYNEKGNIVDIIKSLHAVGNFEIIVVDDNSPDGTWKIVEDIGSYNGNIKLLKRQTREGIASAISDGISMATGNTIVWMDSDFSMPPEVIPEMIRFLGEYDIVVGSRYVQGSKDLRSFARRITSRLFNLFAAFLLGGSIKDYTSGFIAIKREVFKKIKIPRNGHGEYCIAFLYRAWRAGFKIKEVPYECRPRRNGKTKTFPDFYSVFRHFFFYLITVLKLRLGG